MTTIITVQSSAPSTLLPCMQANLKAEPAKPNEEESNACHIFIIYLRKQVTWCLTPSQPLRSYQGKLYANKAQ